MRWLSALLVLTALTGCGSPAPQTVGGDSNIRIADAALNSGSPAVAVQVLEAALRGDPRNVEMLLRHAKANVQLGNMPAAETSFRRALAVDDRLAEARVGLGKILMGRAPGACSPQA